MRGGMILRLVDITMLLLLVLMTVSTIRNADVEVPRTRHTVDRGIAPAPVTIVVTASGMFRLSEGESEVGVGDLAAILPGRGALVEFVADRKVPAHIIVEANRTAQAAGLQAVFMIRHSKRQP